MKRYNVSCNGNTELTMKLNRIKTNHLIHDGNDDNFYNEKIITIDSNDSLKFKSTSIKELIELEKEWDDEDFKELIDCFKGSIYKYDTIPEFTQYKSKNGLTVYYAESEKYLAIISLGEKQPMRYQIILEALFEKQQ